MSRNQSTAKSWKSSGWNQGTRILLATRVPLEEDGVRDSACATHWCPAGRHADPTDSKFVIFKIDPKKGARQLLNIQFRSPRSLPPVSLSMSPSLSARDNRRATSGRKSPTWKEVLRQCLLEPGRLGAHGTKCQTQAGTHLRGAQIRGRADHQSRVQKRVNNISTALSRP